MRLHPSANRRLPGFTLVELLVVIGIIAILISVLLPTLGKARQSARQVQCMSNLRQFFMADVNYMNRWRNWHLPGWTGSTPAPQAFLSSAATSGIDIWTSMEEFRRTLSIVWLENKAPNSIAWRAYIPNERLCPEMVRGDSDKHVADDRSGWKDMYVNYSYGMNVDGVDFNPGSLTDPVYNPILAPQCDRALDAGNPPKGSFHGFRHAQVKHAADKIFFCDAMYWWVNEWGSGVQPGWRGKISNYDLTGETTHQSKAGCDTERTVAWRHKKTLANVMFFDGHCESVSKDRFTTRDGSGTLIPNYSMWRVME